MDLFLFFDPAGVLDRTGDGRHPRWGVPRVPVRSQRLSPEAGGVSHLQGHRDCGDGQHDGIVSVHGDAERQGQAGQQTGEQLSKRRPREAHKRPAK